MIKKILLNLLRSAGYDILKIGAGEATDSIVRLINRYKMNLLLDVGANEGQYALRVLNNGFSGKIISFEPVSSAYKT